MFISYLQVTTTKINFRYYKQFSQTATCLICERAILSNMLVLFFSSNIPLYIKNSHEKNYVWFSKWNLKLTLQSTFSRKSNLKFCIIFNLTSFANAQVSVKIRLACSTVFLLINYFDRRFLNTFKNTLQWLYKRRQIFIFLKKVGAQMFS